MTDPSAPRRAPASAPAPPLRERFARFTEDTPLNLAVFRITVGAVILYAHSISSASLAAASLPAGARTPPFGLEAVIDAVPITPGLATASYVALLAAAVTGLLGLASRASFAIVTVAGLYLWGIGETAGHVFHYHHLVWFAALLAASRCGDALSIDRAIAARRGRPPPPDRHLGYGIPIRAAWLLVGVIFFFPGLWKLLESGADWFWSDNLRNQMYAKWLQTPGFEPLFRIDRYPVLLRIGALAVVVLELAFAPLVLFRRTRPWAALAALFFHAGTALFMNLHFPALFLCYTVFVDWSAIVAWIRMRRGRTAESAAAAPPGPPPSPLAVAAVAAVLLAGNIAFGAAGISDGWPFACYPKFHRVVAARLPDLRIELVSAEGELTPVPDAWLFPGGRSQRAWALVWSVIGAHERARASPDRLRAFLCAAARRPPLRDELAAAAVVRFYRVRVSTVPEERDAPPQGRTLLAELGEGSQDLSCP